LRCRPGGGTMITDQREFSRIPIPLDQSATFLRAGLRQFTVDLIDASPVGFAVTCPERLEVKIGDIHQLRTSEGWLEVRVARIEHNSPAMTSRRSTIASSD
jgi:hypothetical protein